MIAALWLIPVLLQGCWDLELLSYNPKCSILIQREIRLGTARHFIDDIHERDMKPHHARRQMERLIRPSVCWDGL